VGWGTGPAAEDTEPVIRTESFIIATDTNESSKREGEKI
jgi:hypothetical protein